MIIQAKVITIHLVVQKGIKSQDLFFTQAYFCMLEDWCTTEHLLIIFWHFEDWQCQDFALKNSEQADKEHKACLAWMS